MIERAGRPAEKIQIEIVNSEFGPVIPHRHGIKEGIKLAGILNRNGIDQVDISDLNRTISCRHYEWIKRRQRLLRMNELHFLSIQLRLKQAGLLRGIAMRRSVKCNRLEHRSGRVKNIRNIAMRRKQDIRNRIMQGKTAEDSQ